LVVRELATGEVLFRGETRGRIDEVRVRHVHQRDGLGLDCLGCRSLGRKLATLEDHAGDRRAEVCLLDESRLVHCGR
jgi:hypothetical protein